MNGFDLLYRWRLRTWFGTKGSPLFGRRCRIVARGALNSRLVEFEGGEKHVVSGNSLRRENRAAQTPSSSLEQGERS